MESAGSAAGDALARHSGETPPGYREVVVGRARLVARGERVDELTEILARGTLHDYAASHEAARAMTGRGLAYAFPLPRSGVRVVVRHNRHGGLLAPLTGDRFLPPTRAPYELAVALRLGRAGVRTPDVVAYAIYDAGPLLRRSDVLTREIADARDLAAVLVDGDDTARAAALDATARLVGRLSAAGARHHDLNVKNVLLQGVADAPVAYLLDVDRVTFHASGAAFVVERNVARLVRSARKWRERYGARVSDAELASLGAAVRRAAVDAAATPSTRS